MSLTGAGPAERPAEMMPLAIRSLILDLERVDDRIVAVGERGHILISEDGRAFRQVETPVRSTLTALAGSPADGPLYAVGHAGVILKSTDRGTNWTLVFSAPEEERPLLDVLPLGGDTVLAVGAYGWLLRSEDGGASWSASTIDPDEPHLNALAADRRGRLLVAAEFGLAYHSRDRGRTFERQELPYEGSFFGAIRLQNAWLLFGLEGEIFRSADDPLRWRRVEAPADAALLTGHRLAAGGVILAGQEGVMLASADGRRFELLQDPDRLAIADLLELPDGSLLLAGERGLRRMADLTDPASIEFLPAPTR